MGLGNWAIWLVCSMPEQRGNRSYPAITWRSSRELGGCPLPAHTSVLSVANQKRDSLLPGHLRNGSGPLFGHLLSCGLPSDNQRSKLNVASRAHRKKHPL